MNLLHRSKDLEWANGYLDQTLNEDEILAFAERLSQNPDLSHDISDFIHLKNLIKSLPEEKPPHNYFLTRKMAAEARKPGILERFFPACRIAALLCSLGLVLTFLIPGYRSINSVDNTSGYAQKSVNEQLLDTQSGDEAVEPMIEKQSSHGFRGGSPKNELLIGSERVLPDDRVYDPSEVFSGLEADNLDNPGSTDSRSALSAPTEGTDQTGNINLTRTVFRLGFAIILAVSLVWISITLLERKRIS